MAQKTQTGALYQPRGVRWEGRWEGGSKGRGYTFLIIGGNHDDILRSNQALSISFLRITCQAYTYHHFRVLRVKPKPRPLKCKCCHKPLKALLPIAVVVAHLGPILNLAGLYT